jgi:ribonuclease-3
METEDELQAFISESGLSQMKLPLLRQAFSHPSYVREQDLPASESNQRLEFLGDAVLDMIIAEYLFERYGQDPEGNLTRRKAAVVRRTTLADVATRLGLGDLLLLGKGEEETGGRLKASLLADALEALIGAVYLSGGWQACRDFILQHFGALLDDEPTSDSFDYKSRLQEVLQSQTKQLPTYALVQASGPPHERIFEAEVRYGDLVLGCGVGSSKRQAEQRAAEEALLHQDEWQSEL